MGPRDGTAGPLGHVKDGDELTLWSPDQLDVVCSLLEAYTE